MKHIFVSFFICCIVVCIGCMVTIFSINVRFWVRMFVFLEKITIFVIKDIILTRIVR